MEAPKEYRLSESENEAIFQEEIKPELFQECRSVTSPVAIIFGGQPGCGKTKAVELAELELKAQGGVFTIIGDDFRPYHPQHDHLMELDDNTAALFTQHDAGRWVEKAIAHAKIMRCNIIIESTMRVPETVIKTILDLSEAGYKIEARALAVNEKLSWQGVLQRYENQRLDRGFGRMTPPAYHEAAYTGMLESLHRIESDKLADKVVIYKRGAEIIYENELLSNGEWKNEPLARMAVENERNRPWTLPERLAYAKGYDQLIELLLKPERRATVEEINVMTTLQKEAYAQIKSEQRINSISPIFELSQETQSLIGLYLEQDAHFREYVDQKIAHIGENPDLQKKYAQLSHEARQSMLSIANEIAQKEDFKSLHNFLTQESQYGLDIGNIAYEKIKEKFDNQMLSAQETTALFKKINNNVAELHQAKTQAVSLEEDQGHSY